MYVYIGVKICKYIYIIKFESIYLQMYMFMWVLVYVFEYLFLGIFVFVSDLYEYVLVYVYARRSVSRECGQEQVDKPF